MNKVQAREFLKPLAVAITASLFLCCENPLFSGNEDDEAKTKPKQSRLMMMNADGSDLKELFRSDYFTFMGSPAFSSDGKKIALDGHQSHKGETFGDTRIFVINSDGTNMKDLGRGSMPSWSPDATQIAFSKPGSGVCIMDADGSNQELLDRSGWGAQWSPDGTMIVYSGSGLGGVNLKIYDTQEETFRYVFPFEGFPYNRFYWNTSWSADSKSICLKVSSKGGAAHMIIVEIDKGLKGLKEIPIDGLSKIPAEDSSWHPDGKKIIFMLASKKTNVRTIYLFNPTTKDAPKPFSGLKTEGVLGDLCWDPEGKKVIFTLK